jgi:hypothetical protein
VTAAFPWGVLGIARSDDIAAIRRAYAERLKAMDADLDAHAFAHLRNARDTALQQAKTRAPLAFPMPVEAPEASGEPVATPTPWAYGAPTIAPADDTGQPDRVTISTPVLVSAAHNPIAVDFVSTTPPAEAGLTHANPFFIPELTAGAEGAVRPAQPPDAKLHKLLQGDGADDDTPLTDGEEVEAHDALHAILADAAVGNLARHDAAEAWLADLMARSWPRCAPLLEEASNAFGWTKRAGQLGESKAIAFLNARLAGYLFQRNVQSDTDPYHWAWKELSKPGRAGIKRHLKLQFYPLKRQIADLLAHIRKNFPEIESFLDPQRVASWYEAMPGGRRIRFRIRWWAVAPLVAIRIIIAFYHSADRPEPVAAPPAYVDPALVVARNAAIIGAFGPGKTISWVRETQPDLAHYIDEWTPIGSGVNLESEIARRALSVAKRDGGTELDAAMRVRSGKMDAVLRAGGTQACTDYLQTGNLPAGTVLPDAVHNREWRLNTQLAREGKLGLLSPSGPSSAKVPGPLVQQIMAATGLDRERVASAMRSNDGNPNRCAVASALIKATLEWRGEGRTAILRTL